MNLLESLHRWAEGEPADPAVARRLLTEYLLVLEAYHDFASEGSYEEVRDAVAELHAYVIELQERAKIAPAHWDRLLSELENLQELLIREGEKKWRSLGPTDSVRFNQLIFLCQEPPTQPIVRQRLQCCHEIRAFAEREVHGGRLETKPVEALLAALQRLEKESTAQLLDLTEAISQTLLAFQQLGSAAGGGYFDGDIAPDSPWWERFVDCLDEELEIELLITERDHFVTDLNRLVQEKGESDATVSEFLRAVEEMVAHLSIFENHLDDEQALDEWSEQLLTIGGRVSKCREWLKNDQWLCPKCGFKGARQSTRCGACGVRLPGLLGVD